MSEKLTLEISEDTALTLYDVLSFAKGGTLSRMHFLDDLCESLEAFLKRRAIFHLLNGSDMNVSIVFEDLCDGPSISQDRLPVAVAKCRVIQGLPARKEK